MEWTVQWQFVDSHLLGKVLDAAEMCQCTTEVLALLEVLSRTEGVVSGSVFLVYPNGERKQVADLIDE